VRASKRRACHVAHHLEQLGEQLAHVLQALAQVGVQLAVGQLAHGEFQLEHGEHLPQLVVYLARDVRLLLLAHALQVRGQLAQLGPRLGQRQLGLLDLADVPDHAVPHHPPGLQAPRGGLDVDPDRRAAAGQ
jgi:hypothetical protein